MRMVLPLSGFDAPNQSLNRFRALRLAGLEAVAFARQATLLHRDMSAAYPARAGAGDDVVVLLHGLFATAGVLRPLKRRVEEATRAHTASFTYVPGPGVQRIALRLRELVRVLPADVRLHLVGHSMGGVVMRWFMQELGGDPRVVQTISLGSPFHGTRHARLVPSPCGRDIVPSSPLLERLRQRSRDSKVPHLSIAAARDSVVTESALLPGGEHLIIKDCGHNGLLFHPSVASEIVRRVRRFQAPPARSVA
jgi:pimeloyl-ACP methyl ester carboxylesterase